MAHPRVRRSVEMFRHAVEVIPGGTQLISRRPQLWASGVAPIYVTHGKGGHVWDVDGREYIDWMMGCGPYVLGYADDDVDNAVVRQIRRGTVFSNNHPSEIELADKLIDIIPCAEMVRYAKTGGEADAMAVRIARGYTGRDRVAFCGYHGWHDWYLAANLADPNVLNTHLLPGIEPRGVPRALAGTTLPFEYNNLDSLRATLARHPGEFAAVIMEAARTAQPEPGFLAGVRDLTHEHGAVLIFDEVVTGFRYALGGAQEKLGVIPDMAVFAKALSNGYAMAAVVGRREVMSVAGEMFVSSLYWGDTVGIAAALASIDKIEHTGAIPRIWAIGKELRDSLEAAARTHGVPFDCPGADCLNHPRYHHDDPAVRKQMATFYYQEMAKRDIIAASVNYICAQHTEADVVRTVAAADECFFLLRQALDHGDLAARIECDETFEFMRRMV